MTTPSYHVTAAAPEDATSIARFVLVVENFQGAHKKKCRMNLLEEYTKDYAAICADDAAFASAGEYLAMVSDEKGEICAVAMCHDADPENRLISKLVVSPEASAQAVADALKQDAREQEFKTLRLFTETLSDDVSAQNQLINACGFRATSGQALAYDL